MPLVYASGDYGWLAKALIGEGNLSDDIAVVTALLVAEGLIEPNEGDEPSKFRLTQKGYKKGLRLWTTMSGEDRLLLTLFLKTVKLI